MATASDDEKARLAIERLKVRAEMRSAGEDELSDVINQRAVSRTEAPPKSASVPSPARGLIAVLNALPPWSRPVVVLALIAAIAVPGSKFAGWW